MSMKSENYIVIHGWMINELELKGNDLLVYAVIYGFSQTEGQKFTGSLQYLADWCNSTKQGILKNLKTLIDKGLIVKEETALNKVEYSTKFNAALNKVEQGIKQSLINNIVNKSLLVDKSTNKEDSIKDRAQIDAFINLYHSICISLSKVKSITARREKAIKAIIKKYSLDDIKTVFENVEKSDFLTGHNDRGWKADFDFILREDKFINILEGKYSGKKQGVSTEGRLELNRNADKKKFWEDVKNGKAEKF